MPVEELGKLERAWAGFRIMGGDGTTISGSQRNGYAFHVGDCDTTADAGAIPVYGCTDPTALNFNPAATISDGSCTYPPQDGACCFVDGHCEILTSTACAGAGGTYRGDGVPCSPNPCGCPSVSLVCDSISASKSKCCAFFNVDDGKCYFTKTETFSNTPNSFCASGDNCAHVPEGGCINPTPSGDSCPMRCITYDLATPYTSSIISSADHDCNFADDDVTTENIPVTYYTCCECQDDLGNGCCSRCLNGASEPTPPGPPPSPFWNICTTVDHESTGVTYSDEETTSDLIAATISALPAYDDDFGADTCEASRNLSGDETSYSIERFKPRFTFPIAATNFTIDYNEHFVPDVGSPSDTPRSISVLAGTTQVDGNEVFEPGSNGTITITDIVVTC